MRIKKLTKVDFSVLNLLEDMLKVSSLNLNFDLETQQKQNRVTQPKQKFESSVINETENQTSKILQANGNKKIRNSKRKLKLFILCR